MCYKYILHCDIVLVLIKDTQLPDTAPYEKLANEVLIKLKRLPGTALHDKVVNELLMKLIVVISVRVLPDT